MIEIVGDFVLDIDEEGDIVQSFRKSAVQHIELEGRGFKITLQGGTLIYLRVDTSEKSWGSFNALHRKLIAEPKPALTTPIVAPPVPLAAATASSAPVRIRNKGTGERSEDWHSCTYDFTRGDMT